MHKKTSVYVHRKRNRRKAIISFVIILVLSISAALTVSMYWQKKQQENKDHLVMQAEENNDVPKEVPTEKPVEEQEAQKPSSEIKENKPSGIRRPAPGTEDTKEPAKEEENKQEESKENQETTPEAPKEDSSKPSEGETAAFETPERILNSKALVPLSDTRVEDDYFDDVAFVGDSITEGIKLYDIMSNSTVIAARGINLDTVLTDNQIRTAEGNTTVLKALKSADPKKIYIMFGANGVGWFTEQHFTEVYTNFVTKVKEQHPDSEIFLQSILPVTQSFDDSRDDISNQKIDRYNELVVSIAEEEGVHYLDIASSFKDEKGCLPDDSNGDGMHFGGKYYKKWFDYLRTHTITEQ